MKSQVSDACPCGRNPGQSKSQPWGRASLVTAPSDTRRAGTAEGHQAPTRVQGQGRRQTHAASGLRVSQGEILTHASPVRLNRASLGSGATQHSPKPVLRRRITFPSQGAMHDSTTSQHPDLDLPKIPVGMSSLEDTDRKEFMPRWLRLAARISIFRKYFEEITASSVFATAISVVFLPCLQCHLAHSSARRLLRWFIALSTRRDVSSYSEIQLQRMKTPAFWRAIFLLKALGSSSYFLKQQDCHPFKSNYVVSSEEAAPSQFCGVLPFVQQSKTFRQEKQKSNSH